MTCNNFTGAHTKWRIEFAAQHTSVSDNAIHQQDASDILENKLSQLQSLLSCCYGDGCEWLDAIGVEHRDNIMRIAADLANDAARLFQKMAESDGV